MFVSFLGLCNVLKKHYFLSVSFFTIFFVTCYWMIIATDRFVSESRIVLESPQISAPALNFQSLLTGGGAANRSDMLLLRDYMMSVDMLKKIDQSLEIRSHFSQTSIDRLSRLNDNRNSLEELHKYYLKRINVDFDEYSQLLRVSVEAYDADMAYSIAQFLLSEGELHMNRMGQRLAQEQVRFLERQVEELKLRFDEELQKLIEFQNESGLVSAQGELQNISAVIATMQGQLATLTAQRTATLSFQSPRSAEVLRLNAEIEALENQINQERSRLAQTSGGALNVLSSEYQMLEMSMQFARESYSSALAALQSTRIEAARQLKQVSILQSPTLPEYALAPARLYNSAVFGIVTLLLTLIANMLIMIVRDHKD